MPIAVAAALRRAMNLERLPETQTARVSAMLSADGRSSASSRSRSVRISPACTGRFDPPAVTACLYRSTSAFVMTIDGPGAPGDTGCAARTTSAVIALATDPIGRTAAGARVATVPPRLVASAKLPFEGVGMVGGAAPSSSTVAGAWMLTVAGGAGAVSLTVTNVAAVISIAPITAMNTIHTHGVGRARAIRLAGAGLPVACVRAYLRRRATGGIRSCRPTDQALARRVPRAPFTALEREVLAEKRTTRRAGTLTASPVRGLRPSRAARCAVLKLPK